MLFKFTFTTLFEINKYTNEIKREMNNKSGTISDRYKYVSSIAKSNRGFVTHLRTVHSSNRAKYCTLLF